MQPRPMMRQLVPGPHKPHDAGGGLRHRLGHIFEPADVLRGARAPQALEMRRLVPLLHRLHRAGGGRRHTAALPPEEYRALLPEVAGLAAELLQRATEARSGYEAARSMSAFAARGLDVRLPEKEARALLQY